MIAFLFPGQGSQSVGMGKAFHDASAGARAVFEEANAALGFDLRRVMFEGPESELALTANTQPAVLTASVAAAAACAERGLRPALAAGHSLGEYSALVVAGAMRLRDAISIVRKRGEFMQEAVPVGTGAMAAIMGLPLDVVEAVTRDAAQGQVVEVANVNSAQQIVIAGDRPAVERAVALAAERGGRKSVLLPVSAPFHCSLMTPAAERLGKEPAGLSVGGPAHPRSRNVGTGVTRPAQDAGPVRLRPVARPLRRALGVRRPPPRGATAFVEVGPGRVLTALTRRIVEDARGFAVEDPPGLDKAVAAVR